MAVHHQPEGSAVDVAEPGRQVEIAAQRPFIEDVVFEVMGFLSTRRVFKSVASLANRIAFSLAVFSRTARASDS